MFDLMEFDGAPAATRRQPSASIRAPKFAPGQAVPATPQSNIPMLGTIRVMLGLAVEAAFDLRAGLGNSGSLDRFEEILDEQTGLLDSLERGDFGSNPGLLTHRAQQALDGFATAVRQEIVDYVRPGINPGVFDVALQRMTDRAIAAGAAFASLDLALDRPL